MASSARINARDIALFQEVKQGSEPAFRTLFLNYHTALYRFVLSVYGDPVLADDAVQEVFAKLWEKRHRIVIKTTVKYYLFRACRNQAYNLAKQQQQQSAPVPPPSSEHWAADTQNPEQVYISEEVTQHFHEAVDTLPTQARRVFLLKYNQQAKHRDIARQMNISVSMVEKHWANALRQLKKKLAMHLAMVALFLLFFV